MYVICKVGFVILRLKVKKKIVNFLKMLKKINMVL